MLASATIAAQAQVTRYETNNLRKIVYTGQTTGCQQVSTFNGTYTIYQAVVPLPELSNSIAPPVVSVLAKFNGAYVPLGESDLSGLSHYGAVPPVSFMSGNAYLYWEDVRQSSTNIYFTDFIIAFITEAGTNALPFTLSAAVRPSGTTISFPTETGKVYGIEYTPNLAATSAWQVLTGGIAGTGGPLTVTDTNMVDRKFYRGKAQ